MVFNDKVFSTKLCAHEIFESREFASWNYILGPAKKYLGDHYVGNCFCPSVKSMSRAVTLTQWLELDHAHIQIH